MSAEGSVFRRDCTQVGEFIDALFAPLPEALDIDKKYRWMYRGCASASWSLQPSAFRSAELGAPRGTESEQSKFERAALSQFFRHCDRAGLAIPGDCEQLRTELFGQPPQGVMGSSLPPVLYPLAAIAQHHGVPTRLLDWTWNPLTAAYFSIRHLEPDLAHASAHFEDTDHLCVWALHTSMITQHGVRGRDTSRLGGEIIGISVPTASNPNLRAQEGTFTQWYRNKRAGPPDRSPPDVSTIDEALAACGDKRLTRMLVQITLPVWHTESLQRHLQRLGVGISQLFPGYSSAATGAMWDLDEQWNPWADELR